MPHQARRKSASGYYHVVPKGIANQLIFLSDQDRRRYLDLLKVAKDQFGILLHAYVLMSNHSHLLVEDQEDSLADAMKYVHERYGMYYAERVGRTGGIFRKPYWSEPVDNDAYLLCAVRYVHANPAAAGVCPASAYEWSSAKDYLGRYGIADTKMVLDMLGGREGFIEWSRPSKSTFHAFPGSSLTGHVSDDEAMAIACSIVGKEGVIGFHSLGQEGRAVVLSSLIERGVPVRQAGRLLGVSESTIRSLCSSKFRV